MNELTERLANGRHPVVVGGLDPTLEELRERTLELGYVSVKFTDTRGGTDLSMKLDEAVSDLSSADFEQGTGTIHVEGTLVLNYDPVRVIADIDLATLSGTGYLVPEPDRVTSSE